MWNGRCGDSDLARSLDPEFDVSRFRFQDAGQPETRNLRPETQEWKQTDLAFLSHLVHPWR